MGQAKQRGTLEQRVASAIARDTQLAADRLMVERKRWEARPRRQRYPSAVMVVMSAIAAGGHMR